MTRFRPAAVFVVGALLGGLLLTARSDEPGKDKGDARKVRDPVAEAVGAKAVPGERPEQKLTDHDKSDAFDWKKPAPLSAALKDQPNGGRITGFDFSRDPLGAEQAVPDLRTR